MAVVTEVVAAAVVVCTEVVGVAAEAVACRSAVR